MKFCVQDEEGQPEYLRVPSGDSIVKAPHKHVLVCCDAGSLVLWDSRSVHCNTPAIKQEVPNEQQDQQTPVSIIRACAYVCMTPIDWATPEVLQQRKDAYIHNMSTSHCKFQHI